MEPTQQKCQEIADSKAASTEARARLMNELNSAMNAAEGWLQHRDDSDGESNGDGDTSGSAVRNTDAYIRENPWKSLGIGAAIGLVVGLLITRK